MYQRILVAIDDSRTARSALLAAIQIARPGRAILGIAHVLDEGLLSQPGLGLGAYIDVERTRKAMGAAARNLLDSARQIAAEAGIDAQVLLLEGGDKRIAEQIAEGARRWGADLIIAGTHGRRGLERLMVGSVAEGLACIASASVLLVRPE